MKRILLLIHSASHKIYQQNVKALVDGYNEVITKYNLPIDVKSFCGTCSNADHKYTENIISPIDEKKVCDVFFDTISNVVNSENYDIIIKTNTNTVVNLLLMYAFCTSNIFNSNECYTSTSYHMVKFGDYNDLSYPAGMFVMADKNVWKQLVNNYKPMYEYIKYMDSIDEYEGIKHMEDESKNRLVWTGYSDEFVTGVILKHLQIRIKLLNSSTISYWKTNFFNNAINDGIFSDKISDNFISINCKMDIICDLEFNSMEEMFRSQYEHIFITTICKLFEKYKVNFTDIDRLIVHEC